MIYDDEDWFDRTVRRIYRGLAKLVEFQVYRLDDGATNVNDGHWVDLPDPKFTCRIHLYRIKP